MNKVSIKTYALKVDADLAKLRLDTFGIKSEIFVTDVIFSGALGGYELRVDSGQSQRATVFIENYEKEMLNNQSESSSETNEE